MKIMVAGGLGFLGSHLCKRLLDDGHTVFCVDNQITSPEGTLDKLLYRDGFEVCTLDITKPFYTHVDQIYNLASPTSPNQYLKHPIRTIRANVLGSLNLLDTATRCGATILQASTIRVSETDHFSPHACYTESKRCAETIFNEYKKVGTRAKIARLYNTYGPGMSLSDQRVIPSFIHKSLTGQPITVYGGKQIDNFCYVTDMVNALIEFMNSDEFEPVTLGGWPISIKGLAELVNIVCDSDSEIRIKDMEVPKREILPIYNKPEVRLITGLANTSVDFRKRL